MPSRGRDEDGAVTLVERLCSGEGDAWSDFIQKYRRLIYSAIHRVNARFDAGWDETDQEEIFADAIFKLLRNNGKALSSWKGECKLETWIYRIVRNICVDRLRKEGRRETPEEPSELARRSGEPTWGGGKDWADASAGDLRISLEQAMERALSAREAVVVKLIYFEGFTYREVAERLGMTVGAMSGLVYRALAKLKDDEGISRHWDKR